jgi:medium-chain acyl-[acyl-carrier-protein] hydrolase
MSKYVYEDVNFKKDSNDEEEVKLNLICIPQAGLGSWCFHGERWNSIEGVRVIPIEMKGRNSRSDETALESLDQVVDELIEELKSAFFKNNNTPYGIFGFSLGAWIAFELARRLEKDDECMNPSIVICAGNRPCHLHSEYYDPDIVAPRIAQIGDCTLFWKAFERRYGTNPDLSEQLKEIILPNIRSDFRQVESYDYKKTMDKYDLNERVSSPMLCIGAKNDKRYHACDFERWDELCSNVSSFKKTWVRGVNPSNYTEEDCAGSGLKPEYWGTPHRLIVDYPDELIEELKVSLHEVIKQFSK